MGSPSRDEGLLNRLRIRDPVGDQKLKKNSRFLWVEVERDSKAEGIVIDPDIAVHETGSDTRRADDKDTAFRRGSEHFDPLLRGVAVADTREDNALCPALDGILDRRSAQSGRQ